MIPSVLASRFRDSLIEYMDASYPITTPVFRGAIGRFMERENNFFHEPYIVVKLPFRVAKHGNERFKALHPAYPPYVHQNRAFDRLCGTDPVSTLVATGTGSGKTECFLYPVLEYCYAHKGEPGIKAIIIYPMNALASDQALRIARLIHGSPELKDNIKAGMYVGGFGGSKGKNMTKDSIITDHETILNNPPDMEEYKSMKDPKKESNKPDEANRLIEVADEELDSVTGGNSYRDDKDQVFHDDNLYCADTKYLWQDDDPGELNISHNLR